MLEGKTQRFAFENKVTNNATKKIAYELKLSYGSFFQKKKKEEGNRNQQKKRQKADMTV